MTIADKLAQYGPVVLECESGRTGAIYEVRSRDGKFSCNCKGWAFRKNCRHCDEAKRNTADPVWAPLKPVNLHPILVMPAGAMQPRTVPPKPLRLQSPIDRLADRLRHLCAEQDLPVPLPAKARAIAAALLADGSLTAAPMLAATGTEPASPGVRRIIIDD